MFLMLCGTLPKDHGEGDGEGREIYVFAHVSLMYFSPYRPTLQSMRHKDTSPDGLEVELEAACEWHTLWSFAASLEATRVWSMRGFVLNERRSKALAHLNPGRVSARALDGVAGQFVVFWTPPAPRRRRPRVAALEDAADPLAEIDLDVEGEGAGDDDEEAAPDQPEGSDAENSDRSTVHDGPLDGEHDDDLDGVPESGQVVLDGATCSMGVGHTILQGQA